MLIVIGAFITILSQVLPLINQPQSMTVEGPRGIDPNQVKSYWVDTVITPPIERGTAIIITLTASKPGSTAILIFPSTSNGDPIGPPLLTRIFSSDMKTLHEVLSAQTSGHYLISITSMKGSTYSLKISSVWSPFYELKTILLYGIILLLAGLFLLYYLKTQYRILTQYQNRI
jgi:hypothetical protein